MSQPPGANCVECEQDVSSNFVPAATPQAATFFKLLYSPQPFAMLPAPPAELAVAGTRQCAAQGSIDRLHAS